MLGFKLIPVTTMGPLASWCYDFSSIHILQLLPRDIRFEERAS